MLSIFKWLSINRDFSILNLNEFEWHFVQRTTRGCKACQWVHLRMWLKWTRSQARRVPLEFSTTYSVKSNTATQKFIFWTGLILSSGSPGVRWSLSQQSLGSGGKPSCCYNQRRRLDWRRARARLEDDRREIRTSLTSSGRTGTLSSNEAVFHIDPCSGILLTSYCSTFSTFM